ncbi:MAG TPA: CidA/LrgA family protein [Herpetosiphonaceae bacterium]
MVGAFAVLLGFQLIGEVLVRSLGLPIPGPVVGMLLLCGFLLRRGSVAPALDRAGQGLLGYLSLLFVPAGVGIVAQLNQVRGAVLPILLVLVGSTIVTLLVSAWSMEALRRLLVRGGVDGPDA